ncbi:galanin receptor type 2-like [Diadema setosum]|uniref:galanin receptor type 2-like n=1 Tax=Diadema setosum TaxID=31175 RepID=UPI003B3B7D76
MLVVLVRELRRTSHILLTNQVAAELLLALMGAPFLIKMTTGASCEWLSESPTTQYSFMFLLSLMHCVSALTLMALSTERYLVVQRPLLLRRADVFRWTMRTACLIWSLAVASATTLVTICRCSSLKVVITAIFISQVVLLYALPVGFTIIFYGLTIKTLLWGHRGRRLRVMGGAIDDDRSMRHLRRGRARLAGMFLAIALVFVLARLPRSALVVYLLRSNYRGELNKFEIPESRGELFAFRKASRIAESAAMCLNPLIWYTLTSGFRSRVKDFLQRCVNMMKTY